MGGPVAAGAVPTEQRTVLPEHEHPQEQITLIAEGRMELTVGQTTKVMAKGEAVKVPPNTLHGARVLDEPVIAIDAWSPIREDYKCGS